MRVMSTEKDTAVVESIPAKVTPAIGETSVAKTTSPKPKKSKQKSKQKPKKSASEKNIIARFASCGRCSFLLTAYRLTRDPAGFETAVTKIKGGWLTLTWDTAMCKLVSHSYGVRFDIEAFFLEGCCPECRRAYVCKLDSQDKKPPYFRIKI